MVLIDSRFPISVSDYTDTFDQGFLRYHFTRFDLAGPVSTNKEVKRLCQDFCDEHSMIIPYHTDLGDSWRISNYSCEEIWFDKKEKKIKGQMYHITNNDGTRRDGDEGSIFTLLPKRKKIVTPLLIREELEGLIISQQYEENNNFDIRLLIGDKNSLMKMPQFRGREKHSFHWGRLNPHTASA